MDTDEHGDAKPHPKGEMIIKGLIEGEEENEQNNLRSLNFATAQETLLKLREPKASSSLSRFSEQFHIMLLQSFYPCLSVPLKVHFITFCEEFCSTKTLASPSVFISVHPWF